MYMSRFYEHCALGYVVIVIDLTLNNVCIHCSMCIFYLEERVKTLLFLYTITIFSMTDRTVVHEGGRLRYFGFSDMDCGIVIQEQTSNNF